MIRVSHFFLGMFLFFLFSGTNTAAGQETSLVFDLEKIWEIDGNDDELVIGWVDDAVVDENGRFYLLDQQLSQILVIDSSGELISTIGREGDGPGEFRNPASIAWWRNGQLAVAQALPGRLKLISVDGTPGESIHYLRLGKTQVTGIQRFEPYLDGFIIQTSVSSANDKSMCGQRHLDFPGDDN